MIKLFKNLIGILKIFLYYKIYTNNIHKTTIFRT